MTTLYLIRHGEAEGNIFRRLQGQFDAMITPNGRKQIEALAKRFAPITIDAVYASDLTRTCTTAGAIYKPKGLPLHRDARFRELGCGVWENQPFGWLQRIDPERNRAFSKDPKNWSVEGSEPFLTYTGRFLEAMEEVARRHEGQTVAIFSHGMVMRGVMQRLFFPEKDNLGHSENTAVTKLTYENGTYTLEYLNDASHLPQEITTLGRQQWWRRDDRWDFNLWYRDPQPGDGILAEALGYHGEHDILRYAVCGEETIGLVAVKPRGETARLTYLGLLPDYRGKGYGPQLLGEGISVARSQGATRLVAREPEYPGANRLLTDFGVTGQGLELIPRVF